MALCCPEKWLKFFKAACDKNRQQILDIIKNQGPISANQIIEKLSLAQATVSHHLKILSDAEIIIAQKKGKQTLYTINEKNIKNCCEGFLNKFTNKK